MKKIEYGVETIDDRPGSSDDMVKMLNIYGNDQWELVAWERYIDASTYIFKRTVEDPKQEQVENQRNQVAVTPTMEQQEQEESTFVTLSEPRKKFSEADIRADERAKIKTHILEFTVIARSEGRDTYLLSRLLNEIK